MKCHALNEEKVAPHNLFSLDVLSLVFCFNCFFCQRIMVSIGKHLGIKLQQLNSSPGEASFWRWPCLTCCVCIIYMHIYVSLCVCTCMNISVSVHAGKQSAPLHACKQRRNKKQKAIARTKIASSSLSSSPHLHYNHLIHVRVYKYI